jgi:hypothetical protein
MFKRWRRRKVATPEVSPGEWSGPRPFVGRQDVLAALDHALAQALRGEGLFVVLHGPDGSGRAALARRFTELAGKRHRRLRSALGDAADASQPAFKQLAFHFTARRRAGAALRRSIKEWIPAVVPVVGDLVSAIVETVQTLRRTQDSQSAPTGSGSTIDQVRLLLTFGGNDPRIIVLENLEGSDADELAGAFALVQRLRGTSTLFIGTSLSTGGQLPGPVRDLVREAERLGVGSTIEIPQLSAEQAAAAVEAATGGPMPGAWRAWLQSAAPRTPTELWDLLGAVEREGLLVRGGGGWRWAENPPVASLGHSSIVLPDVAPAERQLLIAAGRCGTSFRVSQLIDALGWSELEVEDRLAPLGRRRLISLRETLEEDGEIVDVYAFDSPAVAAAWAAADGVGGSSG